MTFAANILLAALLCWPELALTIQQPSSAAPGDAAGYVGGVLNVGGSVSAPRIKHRVDAEYPEKTRKAKHSGKATLRIIVGQDGRVHIVQVIHSAGWGLDDKAIDAVKQWLFEPAMKDGRKVAVYLNVEVAFVLY
jgi:TonB family protein